MKNTILSSIIAVICTAAICVTGLSVAKNVTNSKEKAFPSYMTQEQAMDYIGVNETVFNLLKDDLKFFKGAYEEYTFVNDKGEEETITVFKKNKLDEAVEKYMNESSALNFKYIQEAKSKAGK